MIDRRPRAPVLRAIARLAMALSASSVKVSCVSSSSNSRWYCLTSAFFGCGQDRDQRVLVQILERRDDRQAADEFRDQAELQQVLGLELAEHLAHAAGVVVLDVGAEADGRLPLPRCAMIFSSPAKAPPQMKRMLVVSTCRNSCCGCLRPPCGGTRGDGALHDLQQRLLHALARHVAGDRGVVGLARDLVDLVDVDDAALRPLDVVLAGLQELEDDVLDILAHIAGLGQRGRVGHGERHVEDARQRLRQQRLAAAGRADQQDVRLRQLDVGTSPRGSDRL